MESAKCSHASRTGYVIRHRSWTKIHMHIRSIVPEIAMTMYDSQARDVHRRRIYEVEYFPKLFYLIVRSTGNAGI